jgi:DNA processing protein
MLGVGRSGPLGRCAEPSGAGGPGRPALSERDAWVVLASARGVGPVSFERLLASLGSARAVLRAACEDGAVGRLVAASAGPDTPPALAPGAAATVVEVAADPERVLASVRRSGVEVVTLGDAAYPARLRQIELPPPVLYLRGHVWALDPRRAVAVVGTRRPTGLGRATAARIAEAAGSRGATIVSGLAYGIDAAAHQAAVRLGTPTVAVVGGGLGRLYPAGHRGLAAAIAAGGGAVVSEFAPDVPPSRGTFPRRNRIISGLSDATVVVEAGARSGALTTAAWALEQGRALFLVPGRLDDPAVAGSLAFLREAGPEARVVAGIEELVEDLGLATPGGDPSADQARAAGDPARLGLSDCEASVAAALEHGVGSPDDLVLATGLPGAAVLASLTTLELRGLVVEVLGRYQPTGRLGRHGTLAQRPTHVAGRSERGPQHPAEPATGRPAA